MDADGTTAIYAWVQQSGTGVEVSADSDSPSLARFKVPDLPDREELAFQLRVTDNNGAEVVDDVVITVNNTPTVGDVTDSTVEDVPKNISR